MGCKQPLIRAYTNNRTEKTKDGKIIYKAILIKPDDNYRSIEEYMNSKHPNWSYSLIPCKKCIGCRLDYSREWANRGYLEAQKWNQNYFVTLTYNDEHLPKNESLDSKEFTNFIKRLRDYLRRKNIQSEGIRYMGCGEYGSQTKRPHYHLILFNCKLPTESFYSPMVNNKNTYWRNYIIEECWKHGFSTVSDVSWNTIAYTARYITKKIYGQMAEEHYAGKTPEFFRTSRRPGIGGYYYEENEDEIYENDSIITKNRNGVITSKPPKYFDRLLEKKNPEKLEEIKKTRQNAMKNNMKVKAQTTTATIQEQLTIEERSLTDRTLKLVRELEKK